MKEQLDFSWEDALADLTELFMQDKQAEISLEHELKM
jgi:hypothetical protein